MEGENPITCQSTYSSFSFIFLPPSFPPPYLDGRIEGVREGGQLETDLDQRVPVLA